MREYLANLTSFYEQMKGMILDALQAPPRKLEDMSALSASLYAFGMTAENEIKRVGIIQLELLKADFESLKTEQKAITDQLISLPAQTDKLKFMVTIGQLLALVSTAHARVENMEQTRFRNSKMRRWENN